MDLKLTTKRALAYEERTGKDLFEYLQELSKESAVIRIRDIIEIFKALGDDYNEVAFDAWQLPLKDKIEEIVEAVREYIGGKKV